MRHRVTTFSELRRWSEAFVKGSFSLFFLVGNPGYAKSWLVRDLVDQMVEKRKKAKPKRGVVKTPRKKPDGHIAEPLWIQGGAVSAFKLYMELWYHMDELVVLDDVDSVYSNRDLVRLLKALCQTETLKTIDWATNNRTLEALDIPNKFRTESRVCIIANRWQTLSDHVGSLMSRGVRVDFEPSAKEVFSYIRKNKVITDKPILDFVARHLWLATHIDIRDLKNAADAKRAKLPWENALAESMGIRDLLLVQELETSKKFTYTEARVTEFMRRTGLSRPMYFKSVARLREVRRAAGKMRDIEDVAEESIVP